MTEAVRHKVLKDYIIKKSRSGLQYFIKFTKSDYQFMWFHKLVCEYLDKLRRGEIKKLMIFIPPQHGKSELSSRRFPAYVLGLKPTTKIVICSYSDILASTFNRDCQNIIESPEYKDLFPDVGLNSTNAKYQALRNNHIFEINGYKGYLKTVGVGSSLTGTTVDIGIIDDPFKDRQEANSKLMRDRRWDWYQDVFLTRLHNDSKQLLLFTRWHEDDIAGRILDPDNPYFDPQEAKDWKVIKLPALRENVDPLPQEVNIQDPRNIDEALWEDRHSKEKFVKRRRINPTGFASLDQQRPSALQGNKIRKEWFNIKKKRELPFDIDQMVIDIWIDGAFTDKTKNDETGLLACYYDKPNKHLYIRNASGIRKELFELLPYIKTYSESVGVTKRSQVWIEPKASGKPIKSMLSKPQYGGFNVREIPNKQVQLGKWNRVENSEPFIASGNVTLIEGGWNLAFMEQCGAFPNAKHDDMVDCLTYAIHHYYLYGAVKVRRSGVMETGRL